LNTVVAEALQKRPEARPFIQEMLNRLLVKSNEPMPSWKRQAAIIGGSVLALSLVVYVAWGVVVPGPDESAVFVDPPALIAIQDGASRPARGGSGSRQSRAI